MLTDKERESIEPGVSILAQEIKKDKNTLRRVRNTQKVNELAFRLKSLRVLLTYVLMFVAMAGVLIGLDGVPHAPERIWSWQEIWDKLSGPSAGVPLDFIKYLTCSLGWFMVAYVALTLVVEGLVDLLYLFSSRIGGGQPGKVARSLKKATGLLPVSPIRRALDGLLLGAAFFAVVTTVAGGHGAATGEGHHAISGKLPITNNQPQAAGLVVETPGELAANHAGNVQDASYKAAFQPQMSDYIPDSDHISNVPSQSNITSHVDGTSVHKGSVVFHLQESGEVVRHKVQSDDTLWSLAERYYGDGQKYTQIYDANLGQPVGGGSHFESSGKIQAGWVLTIPGVSNIEGGDLWGQAGSTAGHTQEQQQAVYTVQPGDSMRSIAQRFLGDEMRWPEIWKLNQGHAMPDGRMPTNPDLIFPGWELKLPVNAPFAQPQPQPTVGQNQGNGVTQSPATATQPVASQPQPQQPSGPTTDGKADQNVKETAPTPAPASSQSQTSSNPTTPALTPPAAAASAPVSTPAPAAITTPQQQAVPGATSEQSDHTQQHQENWLWPMLEGLGSLFTLSGLGFGLYRIGGALRKRHAKGELEEIRRSRWEAYREVNDWESENAPQTRATPVVRTNQWGDEAGFATTDRPLELLNFRARGFDTDRPKLVLKALQAVFAGAGLPPLQTISCIETGLRLTYFFTSSPQTMAMYLKVGTTEQETQMVGNNLDYLFESEVENGSENEEFFETDEEEAEPENQTDETVDHPSNTSKVIPFLFGLGRKGSKNERDNSKQRLAQEETAQNELVEAITSKLGGRAWVEKQRDGLTIIVEGIELRHCYAPVITDQSVTDLREKDPDHSETKQILLEDSAQVGCFETENVTNATDIYRAYDQDEDEGEGEAHEIHSGLIDGLKSESDLKIRSFDNLREEFTHISRENGDYQTTQQTIEDIPTDDSNPSSPYLFFGVGAVEESGVDSKKVGSTAHLQIGNADNNSPAGFGHFQLCLEECNHLLLVAGKGDEAASSVLSNCVFQLAAADEPDELALYFVDRSVTLSDDEIQNIVQETGLVDTARTTLTQELKYNHDIFDLLAELPQTVAVVRGDATSRADDGASRWKQNTLGVIEMLLEELVRRRAKAGSPDISLEKEEGSPQAARELQENKLPRLILVVANLAAVVAADIGSSLLQLLADGSKWGIHVLAVTTYEALASYNQGNNQPLATFVGQFGSLGLFVAPDERSSEQLLSGTGAAFDLCGEGDMLLQPVRGQQVRLRGFRADLDQIRKAVEILQVLYNTPVAEQIVEEVAIEGEEIPFSQMIVTDDRVAVEGANPKSIEEVAGEGSNPQASEAILENRQIPQTVLNESASQIEQIEEPDFSTAIQEWRWRMLQKGLLQPAITIHLLHGLTIHFGLLPTSQKTPIGKGYYFAFSPEPLASYQELKEAGLNYTTLLGIMNENEGKAKLQESEILEARRIDQLLGETLIWKMANNQPQKEAKGENENELAAHLLMQGFEPGEVEKAFTSLQTALHNFGWLESDNLLSKMPNGDLALLSYLALHSGAQSSYTVGQAILKPTETDRQLLRNLEVRLNRTHKSLRNWVVECLNELFGDLPQAAPELPRLVAEIQKLHFISDDTRRETLKLDNRLIWVDLEEFERLLNRYKQSTATTSTAKRIEWLEQAYYLVQSTADNYGDEVAESRLKLLGVWGDHNAADWEDLTIMRQHIIQSWFDLNMTLGGYYTSLETAPERRTHKNRWAELALEHYSQAALVQPTYPEPVKALMGLYHSKNDLAGLRAVYNDYCSNCKQDDEEPEEDVVELYHKAVGARRKRSADSTSRQERKAV